MPLALALKVEVDAYPAVMPVMPVVDDVSDGCLGIKLNIANTDVQDKVRGPHAQFYGNSLKDNRKPLRLQRLNLSAPLGFAPFKHFNDDGHGTLHSVSLCELRFSDL